MAKIRPPRTVKGQAASGYFVSALAFAGITALWAFIVRDDPFYQFVEISGVRLPLTTLVYLIAMPLLGLAIGGWRYDRLHSGGAIGFAGKLVARAAHFIYAHSLLVLFTVAMMTDHFFGVNIDDSVESLDDGAFELAARFAPWLAAYLAGFNLGRALRARAEHVGGDANREVDAAGFAGAASEPPTAEPPARGKRSRSRVEPVITDAPAPGIASDHGDLKLHAAEQPPSSFAASGFADVTSAPDAEPGFLPPQDLDALRPTLRELR